MFAVRTASAFRTRVSVFCLVLLATLGRSGSAEKTKLPSFCKQRIALDTEAIQCSEDTVGDFAALALFPKLTRLSLASAGALQGPSQLPALSSLRTLDLSGTPIAELAGVERMSGLQELRIDWTWVRELGPLKQLPQLRVLSLSHTPVEDLTPLRALAELETIDLCDTRVRELGPLAGLGKLREVRLCETPADPTSLLAQRPGLKVLKGPPAPSAEQDQRRFVVTEAGTELLNSLNEHLGRQMRAAAWFASPQYGGTWHVQRRSGPIREGYHIKAAALRYVAMHEISASWLVPADAPTELASPKACREQGRCNIELRTGTTLPAGALWTGVIAAADFKLARPWRLCRRGEALEVQRPGADWLAPAVGDLDRIGQLSLGPDDAIVTAAGQPTAPRSCAAASEESAANKTVLFGRSPAPIMGIFLLRKNDAREVDKIEDAKARFEQASQLAVHKWIYPDRFCDDAVHQAMLMLGEPTPEMTMAEARKRYFSTIIARHNMMYREYDKPGCERSLERMLTAKKLAQSHDYRYYQFGY